MRSTWVTSGRLFLLGAGLVGWLRYPGPSVPRVEGRTATEWAARLENGDAAARRKATDALGKFGPAAAGATAVLVRRLDDPDMMVRANAAVALGRIGRAAYPALTVPLSAASARARQGAAAAWYHAGPDAVAVQAELIRLLHDDDEGVRTAAARTLGGIGPAAVADLTAALESPRQTVVLAAIEALRGIGPKAAASVNGLAARLRSDNCEVRAAAADAMVALERSSAAALAAALSDPRTGVRRTACDAIGRLGPAAGSSAIDGLIHNLRDDDLIVRCAAAQALGAIGDPAGRAVPVLHEMLKDGAAEVRLAAAVALGQLGSHAESAVPDLLKLKSADRSRAVRQAARQALKIIVMSDEDDASPIPLLAV